MINRGRVPDPKPLPRPWRTGEPPQRGDYLALCRMYRSLIVAYYSPEQGWCIHGRWVGADAAFCWCDLPKIPQEFDW